jgi:glycosyltransferase involved in cell wall biosynthesis
VKIAFVYYPDRPDSARLDTMPFALNSVAALAQSGWHIDLYLWETASRNYETLLSGKVAIRFYRDFPPSRLNRLRYHWLCLKLLRQKNYACVFGLGQIGAYLAAYLAKSNKCPFIYFNDEFPSIWAEGRYWSKIERQVVKGAALVVVPDEQRFRPLCRELGINEDKAHAVLPNIPIVKLPFEKINWHSRLGLPEHSVPFLHAGSVADWAQVPELLSSVPYWPKEAVLVLHSRSRSGLDAYRRQIGHLESPGRVFWSSAPLTEGPLNSLVAYCAGNLALYRNTGPNIEYVGFSSGKIMRSLACGSPVIASRLSSLSFIEEFNLGILVNHPAEIPDAIMRLIKNDKREYRNSCLRFCSDHASFEKAWHNYSLQIERLIKIDLRNPDAI